MLSPILLPQLTKKKMQRWGAAFFVLVSLLLIPEPIKAQERTQALEISPFIMDLQVEKGESTEASIDVINRSDTPLSIGMEARDFKPGEEGQPYFVPDTELNDSTFSLAAWVNIPTAARLLLAPGERRKVTFTVSPPANAEQGTHYGAVLFTYSAGDLPSGVAVNQSVGTILLLEYGQARSNGVLQLTASKRVLFQNDKVDFQNYFKNTGNVHVKPKGEVYIKNMWGKVVATSFINRDAANILPQSDRTFVGSWYPSPLAFGRYTAEAITTYGRERLEARSTVVIWVLPWYMLVALFFVLSLVLWFIAHGRHWHKRRVIRKHLESQK